MRQATQFEQVYRERLIFLQSQQGTAGRRWDIWAEQAQQGEQICFGTEIRHTCRYMGCPWRSECLALRAEWRR